jgi:hypothetical protein
MSDENTPSNLSAAGVDLAAKHGTQLRRTDLKKDYSEDYKVQFPQAEQMAKTGQCESVSVVNATTKYHLKQKWSFARRVI